MKHANQEQKVSIFSEKTINTKINKTIKTIHYINSSVFWITVLIYIPVVYSTLLSIDCTNLSIIFGISEFLLVITQNILAIILHFKWKKLYSKPHKQLIYYTNIVSLYSILIFLCFSWGFFSMNEILAIIIFFITPMGIASYFLYITHHAYQYTKKTSNTITNK